MRKEIYDVMAKEALERIAGLAEGEVTREVEGIREALNVVLGETDEVKLAQYYKNIEEFLTVNAGKGLEYMKGPYLVTNGIGE